MGKESVRKGKKEQRRKNIKKGKMEEAKKMVYGLICTNSVHMESVMTVTRCY